MIVDAVIAESLDQHRNLWRIREELPEVQKYEGGLDQARRLGAGAVDPRLHPPPLGGGGQGWCRGAARPAPFGHMGDDNIHFNVSQTAGEGVRRPPSTGLARDERSGYGVDRLKVNDLTRYRYAEEVDLLRRIKTAINPDNLMNPAVFFSL